MYRLVRQRNDDYGQKSRNTVTNIVPVDFSNAIASHKSNASVYLENDALSNHEGADNDQCTSSSP